MALFGEGVWVPSSKADTTQTFQNSILLIQRMSWGRKVQLPSSVDLSPAWLGGLVGASSSLHPWKYCLQHLDIQIKTGLLSWLWISTHGLVGRPRAVPCLLESHNSMMFIRSIKILATEWRIILELPSGILKGKRGSFKVGVAFWALVAEPESLKVDSMRVYAKTWAGDRCRQHRQRAIPESWQVCPGPSPDH